MGTIIIPAEHRPRSTGYLLREAVERAKSPNDVGAVDADNLAVGEAGLEGVGGLVVGEAAVGGENDLVVGYVEIGIAGRQTLIVVEDHVGHGQLHHGRLLAVGQAAGVEGFEVALQDLVVLVPRVFLRRLAR